MRIIAQGSLKPLAENQRFTPLVSIGSKVCSSHVSILWWRKRKHSLEGGSQQIEAVHNGFDIRPTTRRNVACRLDFCTKQVGIMQNKPPSKGSRLSNITSRLK